MNARHIHVACAVIESGGQVLAAQRGAAMSMPFKWEFPGGKIDPGESPEACLQRELVEEMAVRISVDRPLQLVTHHYPDFTVTLYPYVCSIESGQIVLHEHAAIQWLAPGELARLDWAEADGPIIESYCRQLGS